MSITRENMREVIKRSVSRLNGIKNVDLALDIIEKTSPYVFEYSFYEDCVNELLDEGEIIRVSYENPDSKGIVRFLFFTKDTRFRSVPDATIAGEDRMVRQSEGDLQIPFENEKREEEMEDSRLSQNVRKKLRKHM